MHVRRYDVLTWLMKRSDGWIALYLDVHVHAYTSEVINLKIGEEMDAWTY
jgi:hypothetical protein